MTTHATPVSRCVAIAMKFLRKFCPGLRLAVSFADPFQGHHGGVYQAGNWIYSGTSNPTTEHFYGGRWRHTRAVHHEVKGKGVPTRTMPGKHRYLYVLDPAMREQIEALREPYPVRAGSSAGAAAPDQGEEGGSIPTSALQSPI